MFGIDVKVSEQINRSAEIIKAIGELNATDVLVGVPAEKAPREPEEAKGTPATNALIAYVQNFGSPPQNIPAREFAYSGSALEQRAIEQNMEKAGGAAFDGDFEAMNRRLNAAGLAGARGMKTRISANIPPPLAESTLAARRRRGHHGTRTLVETGQLRNALTYVVRRKRS